MAKKRNRVVLVEDEKMLADCLSDWLKKQPAFTLVGWARDGQSGLDLCKAEKPDLVLLDIEMPMLDGLKMAKALLGEMPDIRLLAMSGMMDPYTIWRVWQSGVHGYIDKTQGLELLGAAIEQIMSGGTFFSPVFREVKEKWLAQPEAFQKILSDREQEVLKQIVAGWDDERISQELKISPATVGVHRKHLRQKLGLHNDRELITYGQMWGLR